MIDLTKKDVKYLRSLIVKHEKILIDLKYKELYPVYAYVFESAIQYLKNITTINVEWKQWTLIVLIKLIEKDRINSDEDIIKNIDNFIKYKTDNYDKYITELDWSSTFDRDNGFICRFIDDYKFAS